MIVVEKIVNELDGKELKRTYSDKDVYIKKVGTDEIYMEAIDLLNSTFEYEETDVEIERE